MIASSGAHGNALVRTFRGVARWVVVLSSIDVYRAAAVLHELEGDRSGGCRYVRGRRSAPPR